MPSYLTLFGELWNFKLDTTSSYVQDLSEKERRERIAEI